MQICLGELLTTAPRNAASEGALVFFVRMTARLAALQSHGDWIRVPPAHGPEPMLALTGVMWPPFGGGPPGLTLRVLIGTGQFGPGHAVVPPDGTAAERASWEVRPTNCWVPKIAAAGPS